MENYLYISSNSPSIIIVNNTTTIDTNAQNDYITIKTDEPTLFIQCIPKTANKLNLSCIVNIENISFGQTENLHVYKLAQNHYKMCFELPECIVYKPTTLLCTTTLNKSTLSFFDSSMQYVLIQSTSQTYKININYQLKNVSFNTFGQYYALSAKTQNMDYVLIFDNVGNIFFEDIQNVIEITNDSIITLQKNEDIARHGFVSKYQLSNNTFRTIEQYNVYLDETPYHAPSKYCTAIAFLEALNINNIALARTYLSEDLSQKLSNQQLIQFFGNYVEFEPNFIDNANNSLLLYYENNIVKKFQISINLDNKIIDIVAD
ncbi:MAG: hypothetical protein IJU58_03020 [Clostridia bacterium]|nr:hypothetical protein [Clostridia bacterium]